MKIVICVKTVVGVDKMSGLDEQRIILPFIIPVDEQIEEVMKWRIGYLECTSCGRRLYQLVPWSWRRKGLTELDVKSIKRVYLRRLKKVYGHIPLYHNESDIDCKGLLVFVEE